MKKTWMKTRHRVVRNMAYGVLYLYCKWHYGITIETFDEQGERPYLILLNHQTTFDQFFVGCSFKGPIYYLATEDIFSNGWISSLIRWLIAPIPIRKQTTDATAVKTCIRVAREGGTIAIAPEGNRTYSGKTEYMNPTIAAFARKLGLPIALYRIEGGYGVQPRWSDGVRKGTMRSYVSRVIEPEEYATLTNDELLTEIENGLFVNEATADGFFRSAHRAEYLERAIYVCPFCGLSVFESHGAEIECCTCHRKVMYGEDKRLSGVGFDFPFAFVNDWYEYQKEFVCRLDTTQHTKQPLYRDIASLREVIVYKRKIDVCQDATLCLYGDRVTVNEGTENERVFRYADVTAMAVLGRNKLNIYHDNHVYQVKGDKRFNALKYVNIYFRAKNIAKGDEHSEFLGL